MHDLIIRRLGLCDYDSTWLQMRDFTEARTTDTPDELWLVEHSPVYTQGLNGKPEHLLSPGNIPVVKVDRGGQVTYHGPGQLVAYIMMDINRRNWGIRHLVSTLEQSIVDLLTSFNITGRTQPDAPGVYINEAKIASLGLRIRRGKSYHGLSLNVDMDLEPFTRINPCGFKGLQVTQLHDFNKEITMALSTEILVGHLIRNLGYNTPCETSSITNSETNELPVAQKR